MTALALRALTFAERYGVTIAVVADDRLSWQSRGPTPGRALEALKAAKGELIDLLVRYRLDSERAVSPATTCSQHFRLPDLRSAVLASMRRSKTLSAAR
jgi:hypothetical protein